MDTIAGVKQSRLQEDGGVDVTSDDVSVKLSDTGWGCSMRTVAVLTCEHKASPDRPTMSPTENVHRLLDGEGHFTRSEGRSKGC